MNVARAMPQQNVVPQPVLYAKAVPVQGASNKLAGANLSRSAVQAHAGIASRFPASRFCETVLATLCRSLTRVRFSVMAKPMPVRGQVLQDEAPPPEAGEAPPEAGEAPPRARP